MLDGYQNTKLQSRRRASAQGRTFVLHMTQSNPQQTKAAADTSLTPAQKTKRRFLKNKPAIFGLIVIAFSLIVFALGPLMTPDSTPDANNQMLAASLVPPGFKTDILNIQLNREVQKTSFFSKVVTGTPSFVRQEPYNSYSFEGADIVLVPFEGLREDGSRIDGSPTRYALADVLYPLAGSAKVDSTTMSSVTFEHVDGSTMTKSIAEMREAVEAQSLSSRSYALGSDKFGRDVLSRLIIGVRISLLVGLIAVVISLTIGVFMGAIAGYFGGKTDDAIMLLINTVWSIPTLLLVFAIVLVLGKGFWQIFTAVGLTMWVEVARIVRGQVISLREVQFVEAARGLGFGHWRIIVRHILPNIVGPVMVIAAANFATAILIEAGLSYLGFGIQPPGASWGTMLKEYYNYVTSGKPYLAFFPAAAIMLMVLAFNLVGNGLRDALDVRGKSS